MLTVENLNNKLNEQRLMTVALFEAIRMILEKERKRNN